MNEEIIVSISCLVYNHEPYLKQCFEGFVMQKTNFKFEVLIHDDASTDGSVEIIKEYTDKYPDIFKPYFQKENQYSQGNGFVGGMINRERAKGKYIALCEGDDYWIDPLKLQKQVDFMENHNEYTLCGSNGIILWDNGYKEPKYFNNVFKTREVLPEEIIGHWFFPTASLLVRKTVYDNYPDWTKKIYSGDQTLTLICLSKGKICCIGNTTCIYRRVKDGNSVSNMVDKKKHFVLKQHILLYSEYNDYTAGRFSNHITSHINRLKTIIEIDNKETEFQKSLKKSILTAFLYDPVYFLRKMHGKVYRIIKI